MGDARTELHGLVADELKRPAPVAALRLSDEIRRRHGDAVAAVLFYGSCLRNHTSDGVLDFYVLVDDYHTLYPRAPMAWLNDALPPNVFHLALDEDRGPRCKYAIISLADFQRATSLRSVRPVIWARFCQPALAVWTRDEKTWGTVVRACADAVRTAVLRTLPALPERRGVQRVTGPDFWMSLFEETYGAELRAERQETIRGLYHAASARYDRAMALALELLDAQGVLDARREETAFAVTHRPGWLARARRERRLRRPVARLLAIVQLLKSAFTFGDWLSYALWKLERHTGTRLEPTERQRRHPFLFGWPLILRVLRRRELR